MRSKRPKTGRGGRIALAWISAICLLAGALTGPSAAPARAAAVSKQVKLLRKQVRSLKLQLRRLNRRVTGVAKQAGPAGPAGPPGPSTGPAGGALSGSFPNPSIAGGAVGTAAVADGSLLGADLAPETIGPPQIFDRTRVVDLPLSSFVGRTSPIDFGPDDGTGVNLAYTPEPLEKLLALEWDDDSDLGGPDTADTGAVQTSFTVPADYASAGSLVLHAVKDGSEPAIELMNCEVSANGYQFDSSESIAITSTFVNSYVLDLDRTFFPGSMIQLKCWVDNTNHNDTFDDVVWLENVAFQYTAEQ